MNATVVKARNIAEEQNAFLLDQFENPDNILAQNITGREILKQIEWVDFFLLLGSALEVP